MAEITALRTLHNRLRQRLALDLAQAASRIPAFAAPGQPVRVMALEFPSPLGIAAGFDRYGHLGRRASALGFGFNEIGSLGPADMARLRSPASSGSARLGINISLDARHSAEQLGAMFRSAWKQADYLVVNLIGPTSEPLMQRTERPRLRRLLAALRHETHTSNLSGTRRVPLVAKLRSLPQQPPLELAELLLELGFDGLLAAHDPGPPATRQRYRDWQHDTQQARACRQLEQLHRLCSHDLALMSVGGIQTAAHLRARLEAGADLVQVHTALVHQGPWLARGLLARDSERS